MGAVQIQISSSHSFLSSLVVKFCKISARLSINPIILTIPKQLTLRQPDQTISNMSRITPPVAKSIYAAQGISCSAAIARPSNWLDGYARQITRSKHKSSDRKADSSKPEVTTALTPLIVTANKQFCSLWTVSVPTTLPARIAQVAALRHQVTQQRPKNLVLLCKASKPQLQNTLYAKVRPSTTSFSLTSESLRFRVPRPQRMPLSGQKSALLPVIQAVLVQIQ
jgi:hypothetical protein